MPTFRAGPAGPESAASCRPAGQPRRGDLAAALATAVVLTELALAPLTLLLTAVFVVAGRLGRWRPAWLAGPAALGAALAAARGAGQAAAGYLAPARAVLAALTGHETVADRVPRLAAEFTSGRHWAPAQLPVALIVAAAVAGIATRPGRSPAAGGPPRAYRSGALVAARRAYVTAVARRGEFATTHGASIGLDPETGRRAEISWREAAAGVLVTGADAAAVTSTALDLVTAAIQHRKAVLIVHLGCEDGHRASVPPRAGAAGCPSHCIAGERAGGVAARVAAACARTEAPLLVLDGTRAGSGPVGPGWGGGSRDRTWLPGGPRGGREAAGGLAVCYDPLAGAEPGAAAGLVMAMMDWRGTAPAARRLCADYLRAALEVIGAAGEAAGRPCRPVIEELARPLRPGALLASLGGPPGRLRPGQLPAAEHRAVLHASAEEHQWPTGVAPGTPRGHRGPWSAARGRGERLDGRGAPPGGGALRDLAAGLTRAVRADPAAAAAVAAVAEQLSRLASAPAGALLGVPAPGGRMLSLRHALAGRQVVLASVCPCSTGGRAGTMIARLLLADLAALLAERREIGMPADCVTWVAGCAQLEASLLGGLAALGSGAGTAVLASTTSARAAAVLAGRLSVIVERGAGRSRAGCMRVQGSRDRDFQAFR